jgi:hypothetical protein
MMQIRFTIVLCFLDELIFRDAAYWADPIVRQLLEGCPRLYAMLRVSFFRIVYVAADCAFPLFQTGHRASINVSMLKNV